MSQAEKLGYYILPDDPVTAVKALREAAGLPPWSEEESEG